MRNVNHVGNLSIMHSCDSYGGTISLICLAATLIFNPLTYEIIEGHGWRMVYTILSLTMLVVGSLTAATFRPRDSSDLMITTTGATSGSKQDAYDEMIQPHVTLHRRTEVIMGGIWFLASTCKAIGYYTPFLTLVRIT